MKVERPRVSKSFRVELDLGGGREIEIEEKPEIAKLSL